jgi:hypothetical protein
MSYSSRAQGRRKPGRVIGGSPQRRRAVLERDNYMCFACFGPANTIDHIVPYSYGGTDDMDNLITACETCNKIASDKVFDSLHEKREHIREALIEKARRIQLREPKCIDCGALYNPREKDSTMFLCGRCVRSDS